MSRRGEPHRSAAVVPAAYNCCVVYTRRGQPVQVRVCTRFLSEGLSCADTTLHRISLRRTDLSLWKSPGLSSFRPVTNSSRAGIKMPPKASSSKRKATKDKVEDESDYANEDENGDSQSQTDGKKAQSSKKAKVQKEPVKPLDPSVPTNITFPINLTLPAKPEGTTRLACWNVCGINPCIKKGFEFYVKAENPDVLIITETKVDKEVDHDILKSRYPVRIWIDQKNVHICCH